MRKIKPTKTDSAPSLLVAVGAESSAAPWTDRNGGEPQIIGSTTLVIRRRTKAGWQREREVTCPGWRDVWDTLDSLSATGRRVYCVAGRASDVLTGLHFWERVEKQEISIWDTQKGDRRHGEAQQGKAIRVRHPLVMNGRPDIIGYTFHKSSYRWVSVTNWADVGIADAARQVGYAIPASASELDKWECVRWPARDQAYVISRYMVRLIDWWVANECGTWKDTPGAAAWSSFLRRCHEANVLQHSEEAVLRLESRACFGGRASTFYLGSIGSMEAADQLADRPPESPYGMGIAGPVHRLDVRAMYPTLLRDRLFPVRLLALERGISAKALERGIRSLLAVASVTVDTPDPLFPKRTSSGVAYPVGRFRTVLSTPELHAAIQRGSLSSVHSVAWYTPGRPFRAWSEWVLGLRSEMKRTGDVVGEAWVKLLANSLGGRLARLKQGWCDLRDEYPADLWGTWYVLDADSGEVKQRRNLAGHVQEMRRDEFRPGTLGACFAHLTAYGRVQMNAARETAGKREVIWQDTDGIMVTDTGRSRLEKSEHVGVGEYGKLQYEKTFHHARFLTSKHYWCDGKWVLSGIHDGFSVPDGIHAHDVVTLNPVRSAIRPDQSAVYRITRTIDLSAIEPGVEVDAYGWAVPPRLAPGQTPTGPKGQRLLWDESEL